MALHSYNYHCLPTRGSKKTLCGIYMDYINSWDYPVTFVQQNVGSKFVGSYPKCPECAEHPDLPMLVLGAIDYG